MTPRRLAPAFLAAFALLGGAAYAMHAYVFAVAGTTLKVSVTPGRQTVFKGQTVAFTVTVRRPSGYTGPVELSLRGLPRGTGAAFRLNNGSRGGLVPAGQTGATLRLRPARRTPLGRPRVMIVARAGDRSTTRTLRLAVLRRSRTLYRVAAAPSFHAMVAGDAETVAVRVRRKRSYRSPVRLTVGWLPRGWSARLSRGTFTRGHGSGGLVISTRPDAPSRSARIVLRARGRLHGREVIRYAVLALTVTARPPVKTSERRIVPFRFAGGLATPLAPGRTGPLDLLLTNPNPTAIDVRRISVGLERGTSSAACDAGVNFRIRQYPGPYPLRVPPGSTRLSALVPNPNLWPAISMLDLATNQDACKLVHLSLNYRGSATG